MINEAFDIFVKPPFSTQSYSAHLSIISSRVRTYSSPLSTSRPRFFTSLSSLSTFNQLINLFHLIFHVFIHLIQEGAERRAGACHRQVFVLTFNLSLKSLIMSILTLIYVTTQIYSKRRITVDRFKAGIFGPGPWRHLMHKLNYLISWIVEKIFFHVYSLCLPTKAAMLSNSVSGKLTNQVTIYIER